MKIFMVTLVALFGICFSLNSVAQNKVELVEAISLDTGVSKEDTAIIVESFMNQVKLTLTKGDQVTLVGFGSFIVRDRTARTGRNPKTGEAINIPASKIPTFKAGASFKNVLNN